MSLSFGADPVPLETDANGVVRVHKSRVTLDTVVAEFEEGATPEEIVLQYPTLDLGDVYSILAFYLKHRSEVDVYLEQRRRLAEEIRRQNEVRFSQAGLRERLLARRSGQGQ